MQCVSFTLPRTRTSVASIQLPVPLLLVPAVTLLTIVVVLGVKFMQHLLTADRVLSNVL
jgi:hypothetical protein